MRKRTVRNENTDRIPAISTRRESSTFPRRHKMAVYCVRSLRNGRNGQACRRPARRIARSKPGANAGDDIASNTGGRANLARLATAESSRSPPRPPQTITLRASATVRFRTVGPSTPWSSCGAVSDDRDIAPAALRSSRSLRKPRRRRGHNNRLLGRPAVFPFGRAGRFIEIDHYRSLPRFLRGHSKVDRNGLFSRCHPSGSGSQSSAWPAIDNRHLTGYILR